ncbi:lysophospholipid acyltransferase family protein [Nesterenkonia flava]|uniref:Lysophospholipid acyltransferase family protein n=1 Tax=Nesterenkonia flava TaxID=469799 RepID=A0ABU1FRR9_9MICC|nr:lysophospholipid acyltransferase family protein [Nesterenkonia flava]MDR5711354.1 lysophospholipid acyltransferase family protein [Nesterenkonia flava]
MTSQKSSPRSPRGTSGSSARRTTPAFRVAAAMVRPAMNVLMGKEWRGLQRLPRGGYIVVANHVSEVDPVAVAHAVYVGGNTPHFMAKDSLFRVPGLGSLLRTLKQIPVARSDRGEARKSLDIAREVLDQGGAILIYPEGTLTRDPELWPMRAKTGAARLALTTGAPLVPITHWGLQDWLPQYSKMPRLLPRKKYTLEVGEEIDLSDLRGKPLTRTLLAEATERIETALTEGVAQLRGEKAPEHIWDRAANQRVPRGQLEARRKADS